MPGNDDATQEASMDEALSEGAAMVSGGTRNEPQAHAMSHPSAELAARQQELDPDCAKILNENRWDLYEREPKADSTSGGRKHVSDAAADAVSSEVKGMLTEFRRLCERHDVVLLTVAEHDELLARLRYHETMQVKHGALIEAHNALIARYERLDDSERALRAEVERLTAALQDSEELASENQESKDAVKRVLEQSGLEPESGSVMAIKPLWLRVHDVIERLRKGREDGSIGGNDRGSTPSVDEQKAMSRALLRSVTIIEHGHRLGLPQEPGEPVEPMSARPPRWLP
jgi:hypothetical protein